MKKTIWVYGIIAGIVVAAVMLTSVTMCYNTGNFEGSMLIGYASMLVAFSMVFVGIKTHRDKYNGGVISFGKAFKTGLFITLIASTIYVVSWLIAYFFFIPDFGDKYAEHMMATLKAGGASAAELQSKATEMQEFGRMYKNPLFNALITYTEILPVGLVVSLISAAILKRKAPK